MRLMEVPGFAGTHFYLSRFTDFPGRKELAESAAALGAVIRQPWSPLLVWPAGANPRRPTIAYGVAQFVARVARRRGYAVIGPPSDWFVRLRLGMPALFRNLDVHHGFLSPGWQRIGWKTRFVAFIADRRVAALELWSQGSEVFLAGHPWVLEGCESRPLPSDGPLTPEERCEAEGFLETVLRDQEFRLPPVLGITFGRTEAGGEFMIEQLYPIFCAPFVVGQVGTLLPLLFRAIRPKHQLLPEEQEWVLRPRALVMLGPSSPLRGW